MASAFTTETPETERVPFCSQSTEEKVLKLEMYVLLKCLKNKARIPLGAYPQKPELKPELKTCQQGEQETRQVRWGGESPRVTWSSHLVAKRSNHSQRPMAGVREQGRRSRGWERAPGPSLLASDAERPPMLAGEGAHLRAFAS